MSQASAIKERPIIFSAPMVRAILEGRKMQTRRIVKPQPTDGDRIIWDKWHGKFQVGRLRASENAWRDIECPYGKPGNQLWVRESFYVQPELWADSHELQPVNYAATSDAKQLEDYVLKPSIHMPRWASRITLKITNVRVERQQDISEEDARAEGALLCDEVSGRESLDARRGSYRLGFRSIWESIHGPDSWSANTWAWVLTFKCMAAFPAAGDANNADD